MAGVARLALALGHDVSGSDKAFYPPMVDQIRSLEIELHEGYSAANLSPAPDLVIFGNAVSRGNREVEAALDADLPYTSGAQWLGENVLQGRKVVAVAGTHGKTTTASLIAHLLAASGLEPGFLIGGVPGNFAVSARLGSSELFVIEADEYDTAFFDKRAKFVHYRPAVAVLNNLEFDHADIYPDLAAIETQFHHLLRCVPRAGVVIHNAEEAALDRVLDRGCWSRQIGFGSDASWYLDANQALNGPGLNAFQPGGWISDGRHNRLNSLAAIAACAQVGLDPDDAVASLASFEPPRRRLEVVGTARGVVVYDDFAHHPTAIAASLEALQTRHAGCRLLVVLELRSNSMRAGVHTARIPASLERADHTWIFDAEGAAAQLASADRVSAFSEHAEMVNDIVCRAAQGDCVVCMSNGSFDGVQHSILHALQA